MPSLSGCSYRDLFKFLKDRGFQHYRMAKGSHEVWHDPSSNQYTTIPAANKKDIPEGTLREILKQAGISTKDFRNQ